MESPLISEARKWVVEKYAYNSFHLLDSLEWLDKLAPGATLAMRLATLTHDMERAFPGPDQPVVDRQCRTVVIAVDVIKRHVPGIVDGEVVVGRPVGLARLVPGDALRIAPLHLQHVADGVTRPADRELVQTWIASFPPASGDDP